MDSKFERNRIFILNEPNAPRLNPALAREIGTNESLILLQLEFWIATSGHFVDERWWCYESLTDLQVCFCFLSKATINRAVKSLERQGLITVANYNKAKYDRTRWFSLNPETVAQLKSVAVKGHDTRSAQNDTRSAQNDTTIPETSTEKSIMIPSSSCAAEQCETGFDDDELGQKPEPQVGPVLSTGERQEAALPGNAPQAAASGAATSFPDQAPSLLCRDAVTEGQGVKAGATVQAAADLQITDEGYAYRLDRLTGLGVELIVAEGLAAQCTTEMIEAWSAEAYRQRNLSNRPGFVVARLRTGKPPAKHRKPPTQETPDTEWAGLSINF